MSSLIKRSGEGQSSILGCREWGSLEGNFSFLDLDVDLAILTGWEALEAVDGEDEVCDLGVLVLAAFARYLSMTRAIENR